MGRTMSDNAPVKQDEDAVGRMARARHGVENAEAGDTEGADQVERVRASDPASVEAVEQEASDGPEGRGVSR